MHKSLGIMWLGGSRNFQFRSPFFKAYESTELGIDGDGKNSAKRKAGLLVVGQFENPLGCHA